MPTTKLTLSADAHLIRRVKKLAKKRNTSVSALFARYVENLTRDYGEDLGALGPLTRHASGMIRLPKGVSDKQLFEEALATKHGPRK
jgi:hypothetical protein